MSWVWALHSSPCFCVWPEAERRPSGGRRQNSAALIDPAAVSDGQTLHCHVVFSGSVGEVLVFGVPPPAVVFVALGAVSSARVDAALEDVAVEFELLVVYF